MPHKKSHIYENLDNEPGADAVLSQFKDSTDPEYIGPGTWNVIHRIAFKSSSRSEQLAFIKFMEDICYGFPCIVCKGHCTEYIKNHPIRDYLGVAFEINSEKLFLGMFVWSWKFHNAVNHRLNKPIMSWDTAYNLYSQTETLVCSRNCTSVSEVPVIPEIPPPKPSRRMRV